MEKGDTKESITNYDRVVERIRYSQVSYLMLPVLANIFLSLSAWVFVYGAQPASVNATSISLLNSDGALTTGNDILDGIFNGAICLVAVAALSFVMLTMAMYDFHRVVQAWLIISCTLISFAVSSAFFRDLLDVLFLTADPILLTTLVIIYGITGLLVFFHPLTPLRLHQFYVIINCSLVSLFYIRNYPKHTVWFILGFITFWDAFAVLAPNGPLKKVQEKAGDYSASVLRLLMFTAEDKRAVENVKSVRDASKLPDYSDDDDCKTAPETEKSQTAEDALNDPSTIRLGMGDFVFYSLLVCKAASSGSIAGTAAAIAGVVGGLVATFIVFDDENTVIPALPISIALGILLHSATVCIVEPFVIFACEGIRSF